MLQMLRDLFRFETLTTPRAPSTVEDIRRSYSICAPAGGPLRIALKRTPVALFSSMWANDARPCRR